MAHETPQEPTQQQSAHQSEQQPTPVNEMNGRRDRRRRPYQERVRQVEAEGAEPEEPAAETTLDRAESLPDEAQPAPEPTPSQDAASLDDLLASAVAPEDEDVDLSEEDLGPPHYTSIPRRTAPPKMIPFRIFPKSVGSMTIYMLSVNRDAQEDGDLDTYPLSQSVRVALTSHPVFQKQIRRFQIRLGVTSLGKPFFLEVNLDDPGVYGRTRRDLVAVAESKWIFVTSDRSTGYTPHDSDHEGDPVLPEQEFAELYQLTYKPPLISSLSHPIIKRGALRKAKPKAVKS
jgi:hypothetical protein